MQGSYEWIFGRHPVQTVLEIQGHSVKEILCVKTVFDDIKNICDEQNLDIKIQIVNKEKLAELAQSPQHQGVIAKAPIIQPKSEKEVLQWCKTTKKKPLLLILDGIEDPHNLGACIRSAASFGVDWLITPKDKSVGLKPSVRKIACGMEHHVPWAQVTNLARFIESIKKEGIWCFAADTNSKKSIQKMSWSSATAIVMGAEHKGVRPLVAKLCDDKFKIPMQPIAESLNVSVATGICLYEVLRQRQS
jgi:23S rRNA (guanosine2251-2'-O)-methyltransferase